VIPGQPLSLEAVLSGMKDGALAHRRVLVRLTLLLASFSALLALAQGSGAFGQAIGFGASIFIGVVYAGMVILVFCVESQDQSLAGLWKSLSPVLAPLVWVSLIVAVGVGAGLILLIIPGLIVLTLWIVAPPVAVVESPGVFESMARSRELVRGNGLRVFLFLVLLAMLIFFAAMFGALIALPFGTGAVGAAVGTFIVSAAINPLTAIGPAALYNCLAKSSEDAGEAADGTDEDVSPPKGDTADGPEGDKTVAGGG
jgi:hypothetical protein